MTVQPYISGRLYFPNTEQDDVILDLIKTELECLGFRMTHILRPEKEFH